MRLLLSFILLTSCVSVKNNSLELKANSLQKQENIQMSLDDYQSFSVPKTLVFNEDKSLNQGERQKNFRCEKKNLGLFLIGLHINKFAEQDRKGICIQLVIKILFQITKRLWKFQSLFVLFQKKSLLRFNNITHQSNASNNIPSTALKLLCTVIRNVLVVASNVNHSVTTKFSGAILKGYNGR